MTNKQAMEYINSMQERRSSLITRVAFGNLPEQERKKALQEINRITLVLNRG